MKADSDISIADTQIAIEFLFKDYEIIKDLYVKASELIQSIFNFYLTIASASIAAFLVIFQASAPQLPNLIIALGFILFLIVVGTVYQTAIASRYAEQTHYANAIEEVRSVISRKIADQEIPIIPMFAESKAYSSPRNNNIFSKITHWENRYYWLFPIGIFQLFMSLVTSISIAAIFWLPIFYFPEKQYSIASNFVMSGIIFWVSLFIQSFYAQAVAKHYVELNKLQYIAFDKTVH